MKADEEVNLIKRIMEVSSCIAKLLPSIETTIGYLKTHIAVKGSEGEIQRRKEQLIASLRKIKEITESTLRGMVKAKQSGYLGASEWESIIELAKGEISKITKLEQQIEQYVHFPTGQCAKEIDTLLRETKKLYEEELVQLRKIAVEEKAA